MSRLFDAASSEYLSVTASPITTWPFTMVCWFYSDSASGNQTLMSLGNNGSSGMWRMLANGDTTGDPLRIHGQSDGGSSRSGFTTTGYSVNTWHHAAAVFTSSTSRTIYLDAGGSTEVTGSLTAPTPDFVSIGTTLRASASSHMSGRIADAAIYDIALLVDELTALSKGVSPLLVRPESLIFYLPAIRDNDLDLIGGLSLTANGSPTIADHPPSILHPSPPIFMVAAAAAGSSAGIIVPSTRHPSRNPILRL